MESQMTDCYNDVLRSKIPPVHSVMQLGRRFPLFCNPDRVIFITDAYKEMAEAVLKKVKHKFPQVPNPLPSSLIVITGTLGIGKTCFLPYLWMHLVKEVMVNVCFKIDLGWLCYEYKTSTTYICKELHTLDYYDTILVWDEDGTCLKKFKNFLCIIAASPDINHAKEEKKFGNFYRLYLSPWNETDLRNCWKTVSAYNCQVSEEILIERFHKWGGVPRIIFSSDISIIEQELELCLKDESRVTAIVDRMSDSGLLGVDFTDKSQWLTLMIASEDKCFFYYEWPSTCIMNLVYSQAKFIPQQYGFRQQLLEANALTRFGRIYELAVIAKFKGLVTTKHPTIQLNTLPLKGTEVLKLPTSYMTLNLNNTSLLPMNLDPFDTLVFPSSKCQKSIDFVIAPHAFQVTTQSKHSILEDGISTITKYYNFWLNATNTSSSYSFQNSSWKVVFVVPMDRDKFRKQKSVTQEQYVIVMDYPKKACNEVSCIPLNKLFEQIAIDC